MRIIVHTQHKPTISITANNQETLAKAIWISGMLSAPPLCSALGQCGKCKVRFISPAPSPSAVELNILSQDELTNNIRLACRHEVQTLSLNADDCIEIALDEKQIKPSHHVNIINSNQNIKLAVDLGTTSLHWQGIDEQGNCLASGQQINPQMGAGSDVVSRLAYAMQEGGAAKLSALVYQALQDIIKTLPPIKEICLAANTAMTAIFLQKNIKSLAVAPYALPMQGHSIEQISDLAPIYIPVQLAPFIGGDISAGFTALMQRDDIKFPFLFVDLGTNGEFILALDRDQAYITSVPLGPALEGIGLRFGHMVHEDAQGIVYNAHLSPNGLKATTTDNTEPQGICGTGYLSIIRCLLQAGIILDDGHFNNEQIQSPMGRRLHAKLSHLQGEQVFMLWSSPRPMYLSSTDIEEIVKVKAAFSLAMQTLLQAASLAPSALQNIYLGGAMGSHIQGEDLETLGFIPYGLKSKLIPVGNTALNGAAILLNKPEERQKLYAWSTHVKAIQLAEKDDFINNYMQHMQFKYIG